MPSPLSRLTRTYERSFKRSPSLTLAVANGCLKCLGDFLAQLLPSLPSDEPFVLDLHRSLRFLLFGVLHGPCIGKWHEFLENRIPLTAQRANQAVLDTDLQMVEAEKSLSPHAVPAGASASRPGYLSMRNRPATDPGVPTIRSLTTPDGQMLGLGSSSRRSRSIRFWGLAKRLLLDQLIMAPLFTLVFITLTAWFEGLSLSAIKERLDHLYWYILKANWKIWPLIQVINFNFMPLHYRVPWQGSCGVLWTVFLSLSTHSIGPTHHHHHQHPLLSSLSSTPAGTIGGTTTGVAGILNSVSGANRTGMENSNLNTTITVTASTLNAVPATVGGDGGGTGGGSGEGGGGGGQKSKDRKVGK